MSPEKHALFNTLPESARAEVRAVAVTNGLPIDDVIQALLGRSEHLGEGARALAQHLHSEHETETIADVLTLAEHWPQPEPPPMVLVSGGTLKDGAEQVIQEATFKAAALAFVDAPILPFPRDEQGLIAYRTPKAPPVS